MEKQLYQDLKDRIKTPSSAWSGSKGWTFIPPLIGALAIIGFLFSVLS